MAPAPEPPDEPARDGLSEGRDSSSPAAAPLPARRPVTPSGGEAGSALISDAEIERTFRLANALGASGMFKDVRTGEQAFAKILIGRDLGLSPTESMMGIHIIEGKPELSANLQAAFVKRSPRHDYRVTEHTEEACEIAFFLDDEEIGRSRFSMEDAKRAGLGARGPWKTYPRNMLFARAMSNGVAFHCPEVTGGMRVYSEGEIGGEETPPEIPEHIDAEAVEASDDAAAAYRESVKGRAA
jgi:hypothetical protein